MTLLLVQQPLDFAVIETRSRKTKKRRLMLLDLPKVDITEQQKLLVNARAIKDINTVSYPEGVVAPIPALNQNAREGKFRSVYSFVALRNVITESVFTAMTEISSFNLCRFAVTNLPPFLHWTCLASNLWVHPS